MARTNTVISAVFLLMVGRVMEWCRFYLVALTDVDNQGNIGQQPVQLSFSNESHEVQDDRVQFIFTIGLEGTGHHFMESLVNESPNRKRLVEAGIEGERSSELSGWLFHFKKANGLWNAHCHEGGNANITQIQEGLVQALRDIRQFAVESVQEETVLRIPLNTAAGVGPRFGMQSYPNFMGPCRKLNYPSLDLLYYACDKAQVDCRHVYIYRDPLDVLASNTIRRGNNANILEASHLYKTMLDIISSEMTIYSSRTMGCISIYEDVENWKETVRRLWGWTNVTELDETISRLYHAPSDTQTDRSWVSAQMTPYLVALQETHEQTIQACRSGPNLLGNRVGGLRSSDLVW